MMETKRRYFPSAMWEAYDVWRASQELRAPLIKERRARQYLAMNGVRHRDGERPGTLIVTKQDTGQEACYRIETQTWHFVDINYRGVGLENLARFCLK